MTVLREPTQIEMFWRELLDAGVQDLDQDSLVQPGVVCGYRTRTGLSVRVSSMQTNVRSHTVSVFFITHNRPEVWFMNREHLAGYLPEDAPELNRWMGFIESLGGEVGSRRYARSHKVPPLGLPAVRRSMPRLVQAARDLARVWDQPNR